MRTCVVCREKDSKRHLVRVVRTEVGVRVDPSGKVNGRGAYLCEQASCWERAMTSEILSKALRTTLNADDCEHLRQAMPQS